MVTYKLDASTPAPTQEKYGLVVNKYTPVSCVIQPVYMYYCHAFSLLSSFSMIELIVVMRFTDML